MKHLPRLFAASLLLAGSLALSSCSTSSVNPQTPHSNTGYIDFYTDSDMELSWEVKRLDERSGKMETVFSKFDPVPGNILRLAASPGSYQYEVWFMNKTTEGPQTVSVRVENAKVTPVHITLTPASTSSVDRKVYGFRPSAKGYGRGTKVVRETEDVYRIEATPQAAINYEPKERMSYFSTARN
jgi:hypothetical protein